MSNTISKEDIEKLKSVRNKIVKDKKVVKK